MSFEIINNPITYRCFLIQISQEIANTSVLSPEKLQKIAAILNISLNFYEKWWSGPSEIKIKQRIEELLSIGVQKKWNCGENTEKIQDIAVRFGLTPSQFFTLDKEVYHSVFNTITEEGHTICRTYQRYDTEIKVLVNGTEYYVDWENLPPLPEGSTDGIMYRKANEEGRIKATLIQQFNQDSALLKIRLLPKPNELYLTVLKATKIYTSASTLARKMEVATSLTDRVIVYRTPEGRAFSFVEGNVNKIGEGGNKEVFRVFSSMGQAVLAINKFTNNVGNRSELIHKLSGPGIAKYYEVLLMPQTSSFGVGTENRYGLLGKYYNGGNLAKNFEEILRSPKEKAITSLAFIMWKLGLGIRTISEAGLIHRDIKLDNIVLEINVSEDDFVIVDAVFIDFDSAISEDNEMHRHRSVYEKPMPFVAPEVLEAEMGNRSWQGVWSQKYDVWSLGTVLQCFLKHIEVPPAENISTSHDRAIYLLNNLCKQMLEVDIDKRLDPSQVCQKTEEIWSHIEHSG